jgi:hypothetical protein
MQHKSKLTSAQFRQLSRSFRTIRSADWSLNTNSVSAVQAFRTLITHFDALLGDWNTWNRASKTWNKGTGWNTTTSTTTRKVKRAGSKARKTKVKRSNKTRKSTKRTRTTRTWSRTRRAA